MSVVWTATSPETGRFNASEIRSDFVPLSACYRELRTLGQGYLEVHLPDASYPLLTLAFQGDQAVLHLLKSPTVTALLVGDESVLSESLVEIRIMDDPTDFTGDFVLRVDRAWALVCTFIEGGAPDTLGEWHEL
jgi:hypothetical protein